MLVMGNSNCEALSAAKEEEVNQMEMEQVQEVRVSFHFSIWRLVEEHFSSSTKNEAGLQFEDIFSGVSGSQLD